ncbi:hypothetical protein E2P81_ATG05833 [Venturia nashicola]|nr:hypothetical protein E2P81_ATG05833 [Venturia nashicola]
MSSDTRRSSISSGWEVIDALSDDTASILHLDEDQTPRTNFPEYPIEALPSHRIYVHRRYRSTGPQPAVDGPIPALRGRLYALKDEIGKSNRVLCDTLITKVCNGDTGKQLREIQALHTHILRALGVLLSNHGSDWTEQTIAGGMSYAEFTNLDGKDIQATEARISEFGKHLDVLRLSYSYTQAPSGQPVPNEYFHMYDWAKGANDWAKRAENIPKVENADVDPAALDYESVKAMLLELNSMLKIKAEKH